MAILEIKTLGDDVLRRKCKPVTAMTPTLRQLIGDMYDTLYEADGVGLAAPQVGIRKRIVVIDVGDGVKHTLINPEIIATEGTQTGEEGCLSVPNKAGVVTRPMKVTVRALGEDMKEFEETGEGLLARAFCHEIDHLDGVLYIDKVEGKLIDLTKPAGEEDGEEEEE